MRGRRIAASGEFLTLRERSDSENGGSVLPDPSPRFSIRAAIVACGVVMVLVLANTVSVTRADAASCPRVPSAGANVAGCNFASRNLSGRDLRGVNLSRADLTGADLHRATLRDATLSGARLDRADLHGADMRDAKVVNASLITANLAKANLRGANLTRANLVGADATKTDLSRVNLTRARLDGVQLLDSTLRGAVLVGTSLQRAQLGGADFTGAKLANVALDGADLQGVVGLSDAALSSALGVEAGQLGRGVKAHAIALETEDTIVNALRPACTGGAVSGAGTVPGTTFHPIVIIGMDQNSDWTPPAVRFGELVACVDDDVAEAVETCPYIVVSGANVGETIFITRNQHSRRVRVVNPTSGAVVREQVLTGPAPDPCPDFTTSSSPIGTPVSDSDVSGFLGPFVGDVPTVVEPPPVSIPLDFRISPQSGPAGTQITVKAVQCDGALLVDLKNAAGSIVATAPVGVAATSVVTVPLTASPGRYTVVVTCAAPPTVQYGNAPFTVTAKKS